MSYWDIMTLRDRLSSIVKPPAVPSQLSWFVAIFDESHYCSIIPTFDEGFMNS